ncbi:conjugal transfer protein TrbH [Hoeflea sp. G2-23]|uniref:Conjugal transfer protein TrbH n=1 Tax=Hoeflea algicola TaxID=2983763 RepID=A0ABT3ZG06_9HYPH|nr:conjugal transfer protein TrbH [Hoeflea algicola]MCY0150747.1 conjugal transfer protein TrbH [Hoeflea algicola]
MLGLFSYVRIPAAFLCLFLLAACQTMGGAGLIQSEVTAELSTEAAISIAADMVARLAEHVGPGNTTIALRGNDAVFGPVLETSLREKGYAVVTDQATNQTAVEPLAYSVDPFEDGMLVRISTLKVELTRMYTLGTTGAVPASPLSVMQRRLAGGS